MPETVFTLQDKTLMLAKKTTECPAYVVWLTMDGKWHASEHWFAFLDTGMVYADAARVARWPGVVASFAIKESSRYWAIKKAKAMLDSRSLQ